MARPGWNASGFNADPWWKHAVLYEIKKEPASGPDADWIADPKAVSAKLDALQSIGIDALIFPMPAQPKPPATLAGFDNLMHQASQRGIHVLLAFSPSGTNADLSSTARFWLSRGVSGFYVVTPPQMSSQDSQTIVQSLRRIASATVGGRIVLSDMRSDSNRATDAISAQLQVDSNLKLPDSPNAANLRALLDQQPHDPNLLLDFQPPASASHAAYAALSKAMAAVALTTHPVALIDADENLAPKLDSSATALTDWYRQLIALHHGNAALRYGSAAMLDFDAQNALIWVSRASAGTGLSAPVVVACNLSSSPVQLSLGPAIKGLGLRGSFLRTLLRTDKGMGPQDLNSVAIPPFGVYIGELRR